MWLFEVTSNNNNVGTFNDDTIVRSEVIMSSFCKSVGCSRKQAIEKAELACIIIKRKKRRENLVLERQKKVKKKERERNIYIYIFKYI